MQPLGIPIAASLSVLLSLAGCTPTVKVEAPDKPIEINLNVKIEHEIQLKVERDVDELLTHQQGLNEMVSPIPTKRIMLRRDFLSGDHHEPHHATRY